MRPETHHGQFHRKIALCPLRQEEARSATPVDPNAPIKMTPERKKIIDDAMAVQQAKATIFNDLNDDQKQKLYALAVKALLRQGPDDKSH
jgi:hypothetical protein